MNDYEYNPEDITDIIINEYSDKCEMETYSIHAQFPSPGKAKQVKKSLKSEYPGSNSQTANSPVSPSKENRPNASTFGVTIDRFAQKVGHAINRLKATPPAYGVGRPMPAMRFVP